HLEVTGGGDDAHAGEQRTAATSALRSIGGGGHRSPSEIRLLSTAREEGLELVGARARGARFVEVLGGSVGVLHAAIVTWGRRRPHQRGSGMRDHPRTLGSCASPFTLTRSSPTAPSPRLM